MHLDRATQIGGLPALEVRRMLRRFGAGSQDLPGVMAALGESQEGVHRSLNLLYRAGFVERDPDAGSELRWRRTPAGDAVAAATIRQSLTRARAERLLRAFLRRVAEVNRSPYFRCRIRAAGVFGDYLAEISPLNKLDLVVGLVPKPLRPGDTHRGRILPRAPYWRLQKSLRPEQWPDWEQLHVELYLLAGHPSLVLHRPDDPILRGQRVRIVYLESLDAPAPVPRRTGAGD